MEQPSVIIHKGGKEEKYRIYVEDYVLSYLKEETGTLELSEFHFYGEKEKGDTNYIIYGAGRGRSLPVFDKYDLLEEIGCRLTQAGPVFLVREKDGAQYEVKGYEVFYQDNQEMQSYLIDRKKEGTGTTERDRTTRLDAVKTGGAVMSDNVKKHKTVSGKTPHSSITVQLGVVLVALVAIVINSTNSYDKMQELNQSAEEVLFAIENQEAEEVEALADGGQTDIVVERDTTQEDDILKLAELENEGQTGDKADASADGQMEDDTSASADKAGAPAAGEQKDGQAEDNQTDKEQGADEEASQDGSDEEEELEALSRNVTRYYEVQRGDTLYTICKKIYGDTAYVQKICELNQITNPDNIRYGQKIILP